MDDELIYAFYDQQIPQGISNGRDFEQWWREAGSRLETNAGMQARLILAAAGDSGNSAAHLVDALCRNPLPGLRWTYAPHPELQHATIFRGLERDVLRQAFSGEALAEPDCSAARSD